ncbi:hypothetical protein GEV33_000835 [Tenebrio molitor]|uniref:Uncharacterized protein n=1 Tax=Tenebrio molitor TaxID=7067 RepID=A0A8J6HU74_TENMO|nr:hypothetical protein GEV33_000835 [Tenebrio molitor]
MLQVRFSQSTAFANSAAASDPGLCRGMGYVIHRENPLVITPAPRHRIDRLSCPATCRRLRSHLLLQVREMCKRTRHFRSGNLESHGIDSEVAGPGARSMQGKFHPGIRKNGGAVATHGDTWRDSAVNSGGLRIASA